MIPTDEKGRDVWSHIYRDLWIGGVDPDATTRRAIRSDRFFENWPFDATLTLYPLAHPVPWGAVEYRYGFEDAAMEYVDTDELFEATLWAYRRWKNDQCVLVRCRRGINRSAMVVVLMLMLDGMTATKAINLVRRKRSQSALFNEDFENFVRSSDVCAWIETTKELV